MAVRIRLGMAEELLPRDQSAGIEAVRELGSEVELALEELRSIAQGVFPSLLADRGLAYALRSLACDSPLPIHLSTDGVGRHPVEIESAVYFTCVEAVQNAAKHAAGASGTWIMLKQSSDVLRFEVRDDGAGFALTQETGRGLRNMRDRIEAVSGRLTIDTAPGAGTRVAGGVELSRPARVHAPR